MTADRSSALRAYLNATVGASGETGWVMGAYGAGGHFEGDRYTFNKWWPRSYQWPADAQRLENEALQLADEGHDFYLCPYLMRNAVRARGESVARPIVHADIDGVVDLERVRAIGGFAVASGSAASAHVYILLTAGVTVAQHSALCAGLRDVFGGDDKIADNDVLRPAGTVNHKAAARGGEPTAVTWLVDPGDARPIEPAALSALLGVDLPAADEDASDGAGQWSTGLPSAQDERQVVEAVDLASIAPLVAEIVDPSLQELRGDGVVDRSADIARCVNLCAAQGLTVAQARGVVRSLRPELAEKLDALPHDDVARLYQSRQSFIARRRAERAAERQSEAEFFAASTSEGARPSADLSDIGNADLLMDKAAGGFRYCSDIGKWLQWEGARWGVLADAGPVRELAESVARGLDRGASGRGADDADKARARHWERSNSRSGLAAMVSILQDRADMRLRGDQLDGHAYELNTPDGIVDLRTGQLWPSNPERFHSKLTGVGLDPASEYPRWNAFLRRTFGGNTALIEFMQRLCGLAAIGEVRDHVLPFLFGTGSNGKSVMLEVLSSVLGDYAIEAPANFLLAGREKHETEIARLHGARLVVCSEVNRGERFDEAKVKVLTGGDRLAGRFMRGDFFDFTPTHTLFLMGNHWPQVHGGGDSFWRRLKMIEFRHQVPEHERIDGLAAQIVEAEGRAILAWVVDGARQVLADGLRPPPEVERATDDYRSDTRGSVERFLDEVCTVGGDTPREAAAVYASYRAWALHNGELPVNNRQFGMDARSAGVQRKRVKGCSQYYLTVHTERLPANDFGPGRVATHACTPGDSLRASG